MNKGILLVVSGPAGVGKGTVLSLLMKKDDSFMYSVSATTRGIRNGEVEGVDYFFITHEKFREYIKQNTMLEYTEYVGNYYGTPKEYVLAALNKGKNIILEIDTRGAMQVKALMPDAVLVFICPPGRAILEARLRGRNTEDEETIQKRLTEAEREVGLAEKYDYVIVNETGGAEAAADTIHSIIDAEKCRRRKSEAVSEFFKN